MLESESAPSYAVTKKARSSRREIFMSPPLHAMNFGHVRATGRAYGYARARGGELSLLLLEARPVEGRRPASAFGPIEVMPVLK